MIARDATPPVLSEDTVDDILYAARTNDQQELSDTLRSAAETHSCTEAAVLLAATAGDSQNTALHYAAANGHDALLSHLLPLTTSDPSFVNRRNAASNTPLHWAALNGHVSAVKVLVGAGADMWVRNSAGNLAVFEAENAGKDEVVAYLLAEGGTEREKGESGAGEEEKDEQDGDGEEIEDVRITMGDVNLDNAEA